MNRPSITKTSHLSRMPTPSIPGSSRLLWTLPPDVSSVRNRCTMHLLLRVRPYHHLFVGNDQRACRSREEEEGTIPLHSHRLAQVPVVHSLDLLICSPAAVAVVVVVVSVGYPDTPHSQHPLPLPIAGKTHRIAILLSRASNAR